MTTSTFPSLVQTAHPQADADVTPSEPYASLMRYKRWADQQLFAALLGRPDIDADPTAAIVREIVGHFHAVDCIFQAHLRGLPHAFTTTSLESAATLLQLRDMVSTVDDWYVDFATRVSGEALAEPLTLRFTDGKQRVLSRADVLLHVSHHGAYHRGNIGVLMRAMGFELLPDRFTTFLEH